ncbi:hypothetical protein RB213_011159, partial [Colletotrichum asianum]
RHTDNNRQEPVRFFCSSPSYRSLARPLTYLHTCLHTKTSLSLRTRRRLAVCSCTLFLSLLVLPGLHRPVFDYPCLPCVPVEKPSTALHKLSVVAFFAQSARCICIALHW